MMNGCEVHVASSGDTKQALSMVAAELAKLGYVMKKQEADALEMSFKGKWFTSDPAKMRHSVTVKPGDGQLTFAFGTGLMASHWTEEDRKWAQQRADTIVAAVRALAPA